MFPLSSVCLSLSGQLSVWSIDIETKENIASVYLKVH